MKVDRSGRFMQAGFQGVCEAWKLKQEGGSGLNAVRLAVLAELVEAHSPFDRLRANELKRTVLGQVFHYHILGFLIHFVSLHQPAHVV